ncbi:ribosomal protein L7/L12 [Sandaracinus amylolyticus]|uniref:LSU ribosomal protein L7/L12 (P1/P2) n=1 Tax=Sandaracinus amylolyticus TaxID=927083 RepID=A0A0F6W9I2_9BACT|nr:LSU ribosomal protein L7/L12 (P1/P2) [Sandaracinus amylolyticus]
MSKAFLCAACSAPLDPAHVEGTIVRCAYCRVAQPSPFAPRNVLASLAPRAGWRVYESRTREQGDELLVQTEPREDTYFTSLESHGTFDDFEATIALRLLWGDLETSRVTLMLRKGASGHYAAHLSTIGTFSLQLVTGTEPRVLVPWAASDAVRREPGALNELRVRAEGDRLSMFLNGRSVIALRDATYRHGSIALASYSKVPMAYAVRRAEITGLDAPHAIDVRGAPVPGALPQFLHAPPGQGVEVTLTWTGANKIAVIKAIREITGLGLADAKRLVESTPARVGDAASIADANRWIAHLAAQGARAERSQRAQK